MKLSACIIKKYSRKEKETWVKITKAIVPLLVFLLKKIYILKKPCIIKTKKVVMRSNEGLNMRFKSMQLYLRK